MDVSQASDRVKEMALLAGFDACGISSAEYLHREAPRLDQWLAQGMHGEMGYMAQNKDKRLDPRLLLEGCKSVISLLLNYAPHQVQAKDLPRISRYAYGRDYHKVLKKKCKTLMASIELEFGKVQARSFVDSAPVMDKVWAAKAGLGWMGKHSNLINRNLGSYFFIAEILSDLELKPDAPMSDYCGSCTKCLDACPTQAIVAPYVVDGSRCISYFTIEHKGEIPEKHRGTYQDWIFGCDICQEVCPWNRFSKPHGTPDFDYREEAMGQTAEGWMSMDDGVFDHLFEGSPVKRAKLTGMKRNVDFIKPLH
ncbi:MAG: tRNA epoxyqueuosine(34) reductase QueG [Bacteroidetes bacterium]|jgi:epoxyqueuosine reductase|nr:tRNA epoxyqueuosine(34) reductase QueG [Bacteroidota bacterium]